MAKEAIQRSVQKQFEKEGYQPILLETNQISPIKKMNNSIHYYDQMGIAAFHPARARRPSSPLLSAPRLSRRFSGFFGVCLQRGG